MIVRKKKIQGPGMEGMIISFSVNSDECKKPSDRTKFFKKLYGWKQKVPGKKKEYEYEREGVLDEMPHMKISPSSFIIPEEDFEKIAQFFEEWQKKVIFNAFKVLIEDQSIFDEFDKFDKIDKFDKLRKVMIEEDFQNQGEPEEPEPDEPLGEGEDEDDEELKGGQMTEEEEAIRRRYQQWQKAKKRLG